ncbi:MAG: potassium-transporting ATPase subunit F [Pseudonocardiaceae bacterium]
MIPFDGEELGILEVAFTVLTIVVFTVLTLAVRGVEHLVGTDGANVEKKADIADLAGLVVSVLLVIYLVVALVVSERFT